MELKKVKSEPMGLATLYEKRVNDLSLIRRISSSITLDLELKEATRRIFDILMDELNIHNASIMLYDDVEECLKIHSVKGAFDDSARLVNETLSFSSPPPLGAKPRTGEGIAGRVFRDGVPIMVQDTEEDPRFQRYAGQTVEIGSLMCMPLIVRSRTIGVINLSHECKHAFTPDDYHGLTIVSNLIALVLDGTANYQRIKNVNVDLEQEVREQSRHLEEASQELEKTRSSLEQSEMMSALGQIASGVAHDFNNILTSILGNAQLLLTRTSDPELVERIQSIELAAQDGAAIVKRVQEFSQVQKSGEVDAINVNTIVEDAINLLRPVIEKYNRTNKLPVTVESRLHEEACIVSADSAALREVLTNLVLNAVDAVDDDGLITISTCIEGQEVLLRVTDHGIGIPQKNLQKLFDPFFSTKGPTHSGLGLSMIYGIVKAYGGVIDVQSHPGEGTTFTIRLPLCADESNVETPEQTKGAGTSPIRILVIDDEPMVLEIISAMLEHLGHAVRTARCGQEGIDCFMNNDFDLVISDYIMPDKNGLDVLGEIKRLSHSVPTILATGSAREMELGDVNARGADYLLAKPLHMDRIEELLSELAPAAAVGLPPLTRGGVSHG